MSPTVRHYKNWILLLGFGILVSIRPAYLIPAIVFSLIFLFVRTAVGAERLVWYGGKNLKQKTQKPKRPKFEIPEALEVSELQEEISTIQDRLWDLDGVSPRQFETLKREILEDVENLRV